MDKSVIICIPTCNRNRTLERLLTGISQQRGLPDDHAFEILLINNDSSNSIAPVIEAFKHIQFPIHYITVEERGYSNVRNGAVSWVLNRKADALIFVDDDEMVPPGWLAGMVMAWEKWGGDIITGPVEQLLPPSASIFVKKLHLFERNHYAESGVELAYANSNNTLVSRKVLETMGPTFHPALNHLGSEDTLFFHQCHLNGFSIYWDNRVLIQEPTDPERAQLKSVITRWFRHGTAQFFLNVVLYPENWKSVSYTLIRKKSFAVSRMFVSSVIKSDYRKLGKTICNASKLAGLFVQILKV